MTPDPTSDRLGTCDRLHVIGNPVPRSPHVLMVGCINWTPLPEPLGTCDTGFEGIHVVVDPHTPHPKLVSCVRWLPLPEEPTPSEGISDEETNCPYCRADVIVRHAACRSRLTAAEATIAEKDRQIKSIRGQVRNAVKVGERRLDDLAAANQRIAELEREVAHVSSGVNDQWHKTQRAEQRIADLEGALREAHKLLELFVEDILSDGHRIGQHELDFIDSLAALSTEEKT